MSRRCPPMLNLTNWILLHTEYNSYLNMAPAKMKAIVTVGGGNIELKEIDVPRPGPTEALVKIVAAAQNPTDCE